MFGQMGVELDWQGNELSVRSPELLRPPRTVTTRPYPGFPTDAQPPLMASALRARGESIITGVHHIDRGYENIAEALRSVGAQAERID